VDILKSIRVFQRVAEDKSFTLAADNLDLVPSAVSRQISELEKWLGVRLINRTTRSLHLTTEGRNYLVRMEAISNQVEGLKFAKQEQNRLTGSVRLTVPIMLGQHYVPRVLSKFKGEHPDVEISLTLMNRKVNLVEEGYDLAIRAGKLTDSNLHAKNIGQVLFKTVASPDYLDNSAPLKNPMDLRKHNCIVNTAIARPKSWQYKIKGSSKSVKVSGSLETNDSSCILSFVRAGHGVAILPERYVQGDLESGNLREVLGKFISEPLPVNIIYPSNRLMSNTIRTLIDSLALTFE